ncbi:unnamed protein product [Somion occarium]|uniref:Uncharacterized protein n=1 Tax=Somion occarium TaxID=3059160 RepID=A0ABP1CZ24_9APHY
MCIAWTNPRYCPSVVSKEWLSNRIPSLHDPHMPRPSSSLTPKFEFTAFYYVQYCTHLKIVYGFHFLLLERSTNSPCHLPWRKMLLRAPVNLKMILRLLMVRPLHLSRPFVPSAQKLRLSTHVPDVRHVRAR